MLQNMPGIGHDAIVVNEVIARNLSKPKFPNRHNGLHPDLHNGYVDFEPWLGQVHLRRPVHIVPCKGTKKRQKRYMENHYISCWCNLIKNRIGFWRHTVVILSVDEIIKVMQFDG